MRISDNFQLYEFTRSQTATRLGYDNSAPPEIVTKLKHLAKNVLEPVRARFGPVTVTSGYRSPSLNKRIGGSEKSQHTKGEAADIECYGVSNRDIAQWIADNVDFDQLILEFHDPHKGKNSGWVHVSYRNREQNRGQVLRAVKVKGKTKYLKGL